MSDESPTSFDALSRRARYVARNVRQGEVDAREQLSRFVMKRVGDSSRLFLQPLIQPAQRLVGVLE